MGVELSQTLDFEQPTRHLWTAEEVQRAMRAGVFCGEPCDILLMELIEGELIEKMPQSPLHAFVICALGTRFYRFCGEDYSLAFQSPLHLDDYTSRGHKLGFCMGRGEPMCSPSSEKVLPE
jgi:hypothetical protein